MDKMIALIALLVAFPALSTDMYLPALPLLRAEWGEPLLVINLTLIGFFAPYCLFLLIYGPLSDRLGRRRPLMVGIMVYIVASVLCALSVNARMMIAARVLQGAGAAAASALSMAICKDLYDVSRRERVMAHIAVIMALAPMLAPVIGGWVLTWLSWPWVFSIQAGLGAVALVGVRRMPESLKTRTDGNHWQMMGSYVHLVKNWRFSGLTLAMSVLALPFFAFIAGSSEIYITGFKMSATKFGYFFAFNAVAMMAGPFVFGRLCRRYPSRRLMTVGFAGIFTGGVLMLLGPHDQPWGFALPMWLITFSFGLTRPASNNLILEQVDRDAGSASSLIAFTGMMVGVLSMGIISLGWSDKVGVLAWMGAGAGGFALVFWLKMQGEFHRVRTFDPS
jgi:DHA1 family bicyclomycin/chloramphenicol resistance-like MFS transporter